MTDDLLRTSDEGAEEAYKALGDDDQDEDLAVYEQLTDRDFEIIAKRYGENNMLRYVNIMEARRLRKR